MLSGFLVIVFDRGVFDGGVGVFIDDFYYFVAFRYIFGGYKVEFIMRVFFL